MFNSIQTNGVLLNKEYLDFFLENEFEIGISYDGCCNSILRQKTDIVESNIKAMSNSGVEVSVLTVLTSQSVDRVIDIYKDFKLRNINFKFSYIFSSGAAKYNENLIIDESAYIKNIVNFFRVWIYDQDCNISVDNFQFYINMLIERGTVECLHGSCMFHYLSIDAYGNIYPCGRSYGIEYCMGNIMDFNKIDDVFSTVEYTNIIKKSIVRRNNCQAVCDLYKFCQGGCNNNALMEGGIENSGGYSCRVFKAIFIEIIKIFEEAKENLTILNPIVKKLLES